MAAGVPALCAAFNIAGSRAWNVDLKTRQRAAALLEELVALFERSVITSAIPVTRPNDAQAPRWRDVDFAAFLYALTAQASDGSFVGRRARGDRRRRGA